MRKRLIILIIISLTMISIQCTSLKRYSSVAETGTNNALADINLFGLRLLQQEPGMPGKNLWDLSADAQSQLIKILNSRYSENGMFLSSLGLRYMGDLNQTNTDYYSRRDLRLVFSVSKMRKFTAGSILSDIDISPADRLEYLQIRLALPENSVLSFKNWNRYETEYGAVDLADVSFNRTLQANTSGSINADKPNFGLELSAEGTSSISRKEDQVVKYRYLVVNGRMDERKIEMEEEGTREIDLTGNIIADVSLAFKTFPETLTRISGLTGNMGEISEPDKLSVEYSLVSVPNLKDIKDTIKAELEMDFVYRNVVRGSRTFPEWDDHIKYYTGKVTKTIPLFAARDYVPELYCIGIDGPDRELLKIRTADNYLYTLKFRSFAEASDFYGWLMQYMGKCKTDNVAIMIGGQALLLQDHNFTYEQIKEDSRFRVLSYY